MKLFLFTSIREVMKADKACKAAQVEVKIMPVPHIYSTECGMCLYADDTLEEQVLSTLSQIYITPRVEKVE